MRHVVVYEDARDVEVAGLFAACLAYGRVDRVLHSVARVLGAMGESPARFVRDFDPRGRGERRAFRGFLHRMTGEVEIRALCGAVGGVLRDYGSVEALFARGFDGANVCSLSFESKRTVKGGSAEQSRSRRSRQSEQDRTDKNECSNRAETIRPGLQHVVDVVRAAAFLLVGGDARTERRLRFLLPAPDDGSACKRLNMWLRWMIRRQRGLDPGPWTAARASQLVIPLDTHVVRLSKYLHLTERQTPNWKMADEVTATLRKLDPTDPVKYDFALSHLGMAGAYMPAGGPPASRPVRADA